MAGGSYIDGFNAGYRSAMAGIEKAIDNHGLVARGPVQELIVAAKDIVRYRVAWKGDQMFVTVLETALKRIEEEQ